MNNSEILHSMWGKVGFLRDEDVKSIRDLVESEVNEEKLFNWFDHSSFGNTDALLAADDMLSSVESLLEFDIKYKKKQNTSVSGEMKRLVSFVVKCRGFLNHPMPSMDFNDFLSLYDQRKLTNPLMELEEELKKEQYPLQTAQEFIEKAKDPEEIYRFGFIPDLTMSEEEAQAQDKTIVEHLNAILDFSKGRALKDDELKTVCDLVDKAFLLDCQTCENICKIGNQFEEQLIKERKPFGDLHKRLLNVEKTQDRIYYVGESNIKTDKAIIDFISQDDIEGLKYLQDNSIDLSGAEAGHPMIDPYGINLFSYANTPEMVDFLAKAGCDINIPIERMCPNFVDPTNEGPYSLLCDAMDRQAPIEIISHMIKAGAKVEDDCEQVLWGYRCDAQCAQEYQTNENHSKKDFYSNLAEIERFIQKVDPTAFVEQRRKEIDKRLKEHKNGGVDAKVSGVALNDELAKIHDSIGTVTPEKAKILSPIIKEAILEKRKRKQ